ncbi:thiamine diphosphokinase [Devosia ginsengisoli]|uniref:thiamine diphosphokinase n=1 Tax=Devosia ginsengisoli TaxID=400770 RepID=UPI0026EEDAA4|nr:thiamine diphosphokinase [Devosia ginsengisoli]MCR6671768.1 thiamine diphosphokinase [Devosia ginsengisoli]
MVVFDTPMAVVGGGAVDPALLVELAGRGVALVGADGGADAIGDAGLTPAAIIGDLDSLHDRTAWQARTRVIHIPEQITTDFQKVLYSTRAPVTLALGMTGKRLDHTLAALSAVLQYAPTRKLLLVDEVDVALAVVGSIAFEAAPRERVSIHPLLPISFVRSTGLFYPMDGLTLEPGGLIGTSNEGIGGPVEVVPADDTPWLLILGKERLWDLVGYPLPTSP